MTAIILAAQLATMTVPACTTVRPSDAFTCHGGQWLPPNHPLLPQASPAPPAGTPEPTQQDADCQDLNPYLDPDRAAACASRGQAAHRTPTFEIGAVYAFGYAQLEAVILGIARDVDGVQVITYRWLPASGLTGVGAQRTPAAPGGASNWVFRRRAVL